MSDPTDTGAALIAQLEGSVMPRLLLGPDLRLLWANGACREQRAVAVGSDRLALLEAQDDARLAPLYESVRTGGCGHFSARLSWGGRQMLTTVTALHTSKGELLGLLEEMQPLAALLQVRAAHRRSREQSAAFEAAAQIGFWEVAGEELRWSEGIYRILGRVPETFPPGREQALSVLHEADRERVLAELSQALSEGLPCRIAHRIRRPGGEVRHLLSCLSDPRAGLQGYVLDRTAAVEQEALLNRTLRLLAEQKARLKELAESINRSLSSPLAYLEALALLAEPPPEAGTPEKEGL